MSCSRQKKRIKKRQYCIGDLDKQIIVENRAIQVPAQGSVDYTENFTDPSPVWAAIKTVKGKTVFDSTNVEQVVTHEIVMRYMDGITSETWVNYEDKRYDLIDVEDLDERHEFLVIPARFRGTILNPVNDV